MAELSIIQAILSNYFEAEGNSAWCLEPARGTPQSGNYTAVKLENTSDLARALYYSVAAPGEAALYQWYGSEGYWQIGDVKQGAAVAGFDERYCYSHMFLSWVYNAFDFDAAFYGTNLKRQEYYEDLKKAFQKKLEEIRALAVPDQGFCAYVINGGNGKQVMGAGLMFRMEKQTEEKFKRAAGDRAESGISFKRSGLRSLY